MRVMHRILQQPGCDEAGGMRHIHPKNGPNLIGNGPHPFVIPLAGVCGCAADNQLRLALERGLFHLVVVDKACVRVEPVGNCLIQNA